MRLFRSVLLAGSLLWLGQEPARAQMQDVTIKVSAHDVATTTRRLELLMLGRGLTVFGRIDHANGDKTADEDLPPSKLLLFGSPKLGMPLVRGRPLVGLDLPLKILIWQDETGKVQLAYQDPGLLFERHAIDDQPEILRSMAAAMNDLTDAAIRQE